MLLADIEPSGNSSLILLESTLDLPKRRIINFYPGLTKYSKYKYLSVLVVFLGHVGPFYTCAKNVIEVSLMLLKN